jgi:hypothetical protein
LKWENVFKITLVLLFINLLLISYANCFEVKFLKILEIPTREDREVVLLKVKDVKADKKGNIFVLDEGDKKIKKFSPEGVFLKSGGGKGEGPGELLNPSSISIDEEGFVYLIEIIGSRISFFDNELNFLDRIKLPTPRGITELFVCGGKFFCLIDPLFKGDNYFSVFSKDGRLLYSFFDKLHMYAPQMKSYSEIIGNAGTFFYLLGRANLGKDRIAFTYIIPENPYSVYIFDLRGNLITVLKNKIKGYDPLKYYNFAKKYNPKVKQRAKIDFDNFTIQGLHFTKKNFLIVQIGKSREDKEDGYLLDIYSPDGKLIINHFNFNERIFSIDQKDNVYTIKEKDDSVSVIKYRLELK